ncbi:hypothetical protein [Streptomonospora salina]|uniref:Uncharacterized protein n=1 Tax=Streptomonospora salina TaxID=104205 RepID=A0A841E4Q7_9ACTN|nr:hypothetical protein [Streptomonospora salina]MBB5997434.1 hypothetical protein [Streptomonospora salina]
MEEPTPHPLHRRLVRMQLGFQSRPLRTALVAGVLSGVLFGAATGLLEGTGQMTPSVEGGAELAWSAWAVGTVGGVCFGVLMTVFYWRSARRLDAAPLPPETDPDALIAARRRLRQGRRSHAPEVDGLVVHLAAQMSAAKRWSDPRWLAWFCGVTFTLGLGSNIAAILLAPQDVQWVHVVGAILFGSHLCALPWAVRSARRARSLAESIGGSERTDER